ncbi:MAG: PQQ-like beta-propeller repeat protein [Fimbriimonadaceae bacterium]
MRALATFISVAIGITSAFAQFNGPAPLSWRWQQPATASPTGSPSIDGDTVYVASGQRMYALNREDGTQKWRFPLANFLEANFKGTPALGGGLVIAAAEDRTLYAVDAQTGRKAWAYIAPASIIGSPQVYKDLVLFQMADGIMAVTLANGQPFYKTPIFLKDGIQGSFSISKDNVLVFSSEHTLYAINIATQQVVWQQDTAGVGLDAYAVVGSDLIYFVSNNYLIGLNAGDGRPAFSTQVDDDLVLAPAVSTNYILAMTLDGKAYLFNANGRDQGKLVTREGGKVLPPIDLKSAPLLRPTALAGDKFAVATSSGSIVLIDPTKVDPGVPQSGIIWNYPIRPIGGPQDVSNTSQPGGLGQGQNPPPPGGGSNISRGAPGAGVTRVVTVQAAGPPVLDKTTLLVLGRDGSLLAFDNETGVDLTPPKVTMTYPNAGDIVPSKPPLALVFKIEDEASGVNQGTLKITVDGHEVDYILNQEGVAFVRCEETGKNHLTDGKKLIVVEVADWMGNVSHAQFSLTIDNDLPPIQAAQDQNQPGKGFGGGSLGKGG